MAHTQTNTTYVYINEDFYAVPSLKTPAPPGIVMLIITVLYLLMGAILIDFLNHGINLIFPRQVIVEESSDDEDNSDEDNSDEDNSDEDNSDEDNSDEDNSDEEEQLPPDYLPRPKYKILATGKWRTNEEHFQELLSYFHPDDHDMFEVVSHKDEAIGMGYSAFELFKRAYGIENTIGATICSYLMVFIAERDSTQIIVFDTDGNMMQADILNIGIPNNESTVDQMDRQSYYNQIINDIAADFEITYAMFCDSMFHLIKNTDAPVVKDGTELPQLQDIPTMDAFIPHYGFGEAIKNVRTLVIHNVKMPKTNSGGDDEGDVFESPIYKTSFISGDQPMIDLSSDKMTLVDGKTGHQLINIDIGELENDDDNALEMIAELIAYQ